MHIYRLLTRDKLWAISTYLLSVESNWTWALKSLSDKKLLISNTSSFKALTFYAGFYYHLES